MNILHELRACTDSPWTGIQWLDSTAPAPGLSSKTQDLTPLTIHHHNRLAASNGPASAVMSHTK
ncbi:MAG: hypothetical protein ACP5I1_04460 [Candidatus Hinthialibacter sp.]